MKKLTANIVVILFVVLILSGCGKSSATSDENNAPAYDVTFDVTFESNLLLNKYNVNVKLDDDSIGKIEHGGTFSQTVEGVRQGEHKITFTKDGDVTIKGSVDIDVEKDITFKCSIQANRSEVEILSYETLDGTEAAAGAESNTNEELLKHILGTYIGVNGSALTFSEDGTAAYYYYEWDQPETNCPWIYEDNRLTWKSSEMMCTIYADISNGDTSSLTFKSDSLFWDDEVYNKVSDSGSVLSVDDYKKLIADNTEIKESSSDASDNNNTAAEGKTENQTEGVATTSPLEDDFKYDLAYKLENPSYTIYFLFNTTEKTVCYFITDGSDPMYGTYTGTFDTGILLDYPNDGFQQKAKYKQAGNDAILLVADPNDTNFEYPYECKKASLTEAKDALN